MDVDNLELEKLTLDPTTKMWQYIKHGDGV